MQTIEGVFRNGRVELRQRPSAHDNTRVLVTFTGEPAPVESPGGSSAPPLTTGPERDALIDELLAEMDAGIDFGAGRHPTREEIYDERADELERRRRENR